MNTLSILVYAPSKKKKSILVYGLVLKIIYEKKKKTVNF